MVDHQTNPVIELPTDSLAAERVQEPIQVVRSSSQEARQLERSLKNIYLISGLGADERVFRLLKFEGYEPIHVRWLEPQRGEAIAAYAQRLSHQIQSPHPIIVSLSFGGLIAVEIAKQIEVEQVILISSAKNESEIPPYFKIFRWLPIHRIFPFKSLLWALYTLANWLFSIESIEERTLLKSILLDTDPVFLHWALHKVVTWKNDFVPADVHHIHGTRDRIFPSWFVKADFIVEQGGHLMILNRAGLISDLITQIIEQEKAAKSTSLIESEP